MKKKLKVLWFSNRPGNAVGFFGKELKANGGWIQSLDIAMQELCDLHIVFYHKKKIKPFHYKKTKYYPIYIENRSLIKKYYLNITSNVTRNEDVHKYLEIISDIQPDLIHIHGTENPFSYLLEKIDIPAVLSIQGNITVYHHKYLSGLGKKSMHVASSFLEKFSGMKPFYIQYNKFKNKMKVEEKAFSLVSNYIGRTEWDKRISSILSPQSSYFHNDELLRDKFYSTKWNKKNIEDTFIIYTTTSNVFYKGLETIIETIEILKKAGFCNFKWWIGGLSRTDLIIKAVQKQVKSEFLYTELLFLGSLNEDQIIKFMKKSNLYVMPSHIENSPNSLCEAMMLGMPCISTNVGGVSSLLENGREGVLIQDGDPWSLAGAIKECYLNYPKYLEYGENARKRAIKRHDRKAVAAELLNIYHQVYNK